MDPCVLFGGVLCGLKIAVFKMCVRDASLVFTFRIRRVCEIWARRLTRNLRYLGELLLQRERL